LEVLDDAGVSEDFVGFVFVELVGDSVFAPEASLPLELSPDSLFFYDSPLPLEPLPLLA
jgi:hypothetical protein